jgi:hypothetical protein
MQLPEVGAVSSVATGSNVGVSLEVNVIAVGVINPYPGEVGSGDLSILLGWRIINSETLSGQIPTSHISLFLLRIEGKASASMDECSKGDLI